MNKLRYLSLITVISVWAIIVGGIVYSHIAYFPPYLSHLPESNNLIIGEYGIQDAAFWSIIHPLAIISIFIALILNWKLKRIRKLILITLGIYVLAIIATVFYFYPELVAFADSTNNSSMNPSEWSQRGQHWQHLSWLRGSSMFIGFILLLIALTKTEPE